MFCVQDRGGSIVGCGRGGGDVPKIVDSIERQGINMVFVIGGNGSHAGANAISAECASRGLKVSVVGIPKTIDNDILHIDKTFGFDTAVEEAQKAIKAAAVEAKSALNGVGVVKLMGRQSGFIAMHAALASGSVDVCLIPEVPFAMEGPNGVVEHVKNLLATQGHAVICLAEGAGQEYVQETGTDAGGNPVLGDIGPWFCKRCVFCNSLVYTRDWTDVVFCLQFKAGDVVRRQVHRSDLHGQRGHRERARLHLLHHLGTERGARGVCRVHGNLNRHGEHPRGFPANRAAHREGAAGGSRRPDVAQAADVDGPAGLCYERLMPMRRIGMGSVYFCNGNVRLK